MKRIEFDTKQLMGVRVCTSDFEDGGQHDASAQRVPVRIGIKEDVPNKRRP